MNLGERIRHARLERGLSIDDIAQKTFIRASHIEAIERNDFAVLPPTRLHYFLRDVALMVGLDPAEIEQELPAIEKSYAVASPPTPAAPPSAGRSRRREKPVRAKKEPKSRGEGKKRPVMSFGEPETGGDETSSPQPQRATPPPPQGTTRQNVGKGLSGLLARRRPRYSPLDQGNPTLVRGLITAALVLLLGVGVVYLLGGFGDDSDGPGADTAIESEETPTRILTQADGTDEGTPLDSNNIPVGDSIVLEGRFVAQAWYNIEMDNEREDTGLLDSGEVRVWKATEKFTISLGNAGGVEFRLNGKPIGTLGKLGETVREKVLKVETSTPATAPAGAGTTSGESGAAASTSSSRTPRRTTSSRRRRSTAQQQERETQRPRLQESTPENSIGN